MKPARYLKEDELVRTAVKTLAKQLGPVETQRFLSMPMPARTDAVQRHRAWQAQLDKKAFLNQAFKTKA